MALSLLQDLVCQMSPCSGYKRMVCAPLWATKPQAGKLQIDQIPDGRGVCPAPTTVARIVAHFPTAKLVF